MASVPPILVEDQTDVEFFDKLVDDDYGARESLSKSDDLARSLSMLSLPDEEDSGSASDVLNDSTPLESSEISNDVPLVSMFHPATLPEEVSGDVKRKSIKEVQWSDFSVDSHQFGFSGFESDIFLGSVGGNLANAQTDSESKSTFADKSSANISSYADSYGQQNNLHSSVSEHSVNSLEIQNWENIYPGWQYEPNTGQWHQLDGYDADRKVRFDDNVLPGQNSYEEGEAKTQNAYDISFSERSDSLYHKQASHSALETISEESSIPCSWNQVSQGSIGYPPNMVFDPQYPEWYYDTTTQQWYTLESYNVYLLNASSVNGDPQTTTANASAGGSTLGDNFTSHGNVQQYGQSAMQEHGGQTSSVFGQQNEWLEQSSQGHWNACGGGSDLRNMLQEQSGQASSGNASGTSYAQKDMWQPELLPENHDGSSLASNQLAGSFYHSGEFTGSPSFKNFGSNNLEPIVKHSYGSSHMIASQGYVPAEIKYHSNQPKWEQSHLEQLSNSNYSTEHSANSNGQSFQAVNSSYLQFGNSTRDGRSSAGRPPHALVAFGFGGKIIVTKDIISSNSSFGSGNQGTVGGVISVHSLADVVKTKASSLNILAGGGFGYFHSLCEQSFPGPLVGGNASSKDVNKWIDETMINYESSSIDLQTCELLRLLFSLLKTLCQHYGKLRSPYGVNSLEGSDAPESMVSQLFASVKKPNGPFEGLVSARDCLKSFPMEGQIRATAIEVQHLLVSGRRKEALQCAQEGQLWGPALVLAAQLGEQFYVDTVKQMARHQFVYGSPLRTLCLLIAGHPADVFSSENSSSGFTGAANVAYQSYQVLPNSMLDDWKENLGIITSNRTKDDELVIIHLGDCLWKERGEVTAAHTCYLVAEANFESYSDSARLCLIGADHWKNPRTYASPDAIQRTEIYEYSKVIGNTQFVLLPFQPYKLVYAYMLAEVGKVTDSLRYCQASMKLLKNAGRSPEVEMWRTLFSSLEERLRIQQQGGYGTNLAPAKLVGKLLNSIDRSIHRMIGAPPLPPMPQNVGNGRDNDLLFAKVPSSQSTTAITSLIPSASVEAISDLASDNNRKTVHNRSISEPNFGGSPKQISSKDSNALGQSNLSLSGGPSRFGRFGSQLLQKTIGWVSWSKNDHQAKLGESNKFYYDEKLKRWVEEGAEPPPEETSLPPPPTAAAFQNGLSNYNINNALKSNSHAPIPAQETTQRSPSENGLGFPPLPPTQNQFSAQSRMGVRSRYVDTFNKGGGSFTASFQSPSTQSAKFLSGAKLMVPSAPMHFEDETNDATKAGIHESTFTQEPSSAVIQESVLPPESTPSSSSMQRFPSMDQIALSNSLPSGKGALSHTRAASWSGAYADSSSAKVSGMEQSFIGSGLVSTLSLQNKTPRGSSVHINGSVSALDELQEVEL